MSSNERPKQEQHAEEEVDKARRKLLRVLIYAAPAIVSTVVVKPAHAQAVSCGPVTCPPNGGPCGPTNCPPNGGGCPPNGGPCGPSNCRPRT